jgi:hypothetical protein
MPARKPDGPDPPPAKHPISEELAAEYGVLPDIVGLTDLDALNAAVRSMFILLGEATALARAGDDRAAAVKALGAVYRFIMRFRTGLDHNLHGPLLRLLSALLALDDNNVDPILRPSRIGGRAPDSGFRQALIGCAVAAVGRLRWTRMDRKVACKIVAETMRKAGVDPARGANALTERTVRHWCETDAADVGRHSIIAAIADTLLSELWRTRLQSEPTNLARKLILDALVDSVRQLNTNGRLSEKAS